MIALLLKKLELCEAPSQEELDRHFYRLIKRYHPDRNPEKQDWANQKSREIIAAYRVLKKSLSTKNLAACSAAGSGLGYGTYPYHKSHQPHTHKTEKKQGRFVSFQILRGEANCLIPLPAVYQIERIEELHSSHSSLPKPNELLYLSKNGQIRKAKHSELLFADPKQILFRLLPENKTRAILLDPAWKMAKQIEIDICNTPILPSSKAKGVRIYYKNEIFYCPAELVFQMNPVQPQIQKSAQAQS